MAHSVLVRAWVVVAVLMATVGAFTPAKTLPHKIWLKQHFKRNATLSNVTELSPAIQQFRRSVEDDNVINMLFSQMLEQVPRVYPYNLDPLEQPEIHTFPQLLRTLNDIVTAAPSWSSAAEAVGLVGSPMSVIFDYPVNTPAGYAAFLEPKVNKILKKLLNAWGKYLNSCDSASVLNDSDQGWFGADAQKQIMQTANEPYKTNYTFQQCFKSNPNASHWGYQSWDDFFTREFNDGVRPVASPNNDSVIVNSCEAEVYNVSMNAKLRDDFWIKGQPYSIEDMLAYDMLAPQFNGATVYQAYLSGISYHRWHAPVSGRIVKAYVQDGTYFSEPLYENKPDTYDIDPMAPFTSQGGYLTALATRGIIFIQADNPAIGLMAFIAVGMFEISTCDITVNEGDRVEKGDQLGMFHYGGSSYVLLFQKDVNVSGFPMPSNSSVNIPVKGQLAVVSP